MYCKKCGSQNDDNALNCVSCGEVLQHVQPLEQLSQPVSNHLVPAILVTLFCCLPFGIVAIVYAAQVNGKLQANDYAGAMDYSKKTAMWSWISFGLGILATIIGFAMGFFGSAASQM
jgi:uncharacterized membrane protein YvbJ